MFSNDGTVQLSLSRYLHLAVDLIYQPTAGPTNLESVNETDQAVTADTAPPAATVFRLQESRRMRSSEIHYFDHPKFGAIALVTPYEIPTVEVKLPQPVVSQGVETDSAAPTTDGSDAPTLEQRNEVRQ